MSTAETQTSPVAPTERTSSKKNEFNDGRKRPIYSWQNSVRDWFKQSFHSQYTDAQVEHNLLSRLPFYPESDGKRSAVIINTKLTDGNYIHELFIENTEQPTKSLTKADGPTPASDIVLIHGYAASLGLFIDNFDSLSSIPGIKIHAIDLLGFGFSSRPRFPNFPSNTKEDIYKIEDWFIDALEEWRKKRNINRFILMGHSFGGYLSCAYALKYNRRIIEASSHINNNLIEKLILISPVGLERSKFSLLKDINHSKAISDEQRQFENQKSPEISISKEVTADQEEIVHSEKKQDISQDTNTENKTNRAKIIAALWKRNYSPFSIVRNIGPLKSKMISGWTTHRFAHIYYQDPQQFQSMHDYIYRVFNGKGSGEYAITRILEIGALPKLPLLDRCPEKFVKMKLPSFWLYGDKDWMNEEAGYEITQEINRLSQESYETNLASFGILPNSGHHLYLDNPKMFAKEVFRFIGFKR